MHTQQQNIAGQREPRINRDHFFMTVCLYGILLDLCPEPLLVSQLSPTLWLFPTLVLAGFLRLCTVAIVGI